MHVTDARGRPSGRSAVRVLLAAGLALCLGVAAIYGQVSRHDFIPYYDDGQYVTDNARVLEGITSDGVRWAFTQTAAANWHPLTWLSHMLDVELFGLRPGAHHAVNALLHLANTLLVLVVMHRLTGAAWRSALVAGLFAVHPLNVESVAWVAERKNLLCTLFGLLALAAYRRFVRTRRPRDYCLVAGLFALGLLAKPMLVTFPFLLLLLDFWPLNRAGFPPRATQVARLALEKAPLLALAAASSLTTFFVQAADGTVKSLGAFPFPARAANALASYARYVVRTLWPNGLGAVYSYPLRIEWAWTTAGLLLLVCVSLLAVAAARRRPALLVGWLWFLGTLVPVIGLVQVWFAGSADRYLYLSGLGLFTLIAWGGPVGAAGASGPRRLAVPAVAGALLAFASLSRLQTAWWSDEITLFRRTLAVTRENWIAENYLGFMLAKKGAREESVQHYREAIRINPGYAEPYVSLGQAMSSRGRPEEAVALYRRAIEIDPAFTRAWLSMGMALARQGKRQEALEAYRKVAELDPGLRDLMAQWSAALR